MTKYEMVAILNNVMNNKTNFADVQNVIDALNADIRKELNKGKKTSKNLLKACNNVIKVATKLKNEKMMGAWVANGNQYVCDGYRVIINHGEPLALVELEGTPYDVQKMIDGAVSKLVLKIELPTLAELEADIKRLKAEAKANKLKCPKYCYGIHANGMYYYYDAEYLRDAIMATGVNVAECESPRTPIYLKGVDADCFLLPINTAVERVGAFVR